MPTTARHQDANGYLTIKRCPISSFGIFQYSAAQVGLDGDPNRIINVYRPEEAVADPELLESLQLVPLINDHEMLSGFAGDDSATAPEQYGVDGVLSNVAYDTPWTVGDLKVYSRQFQSDLNAGKKDLSLGYTCDFLAQSGTFDGQDYEVIQTNMRGNHIALVDVGRVPGARILDGKRLCFDHLDLSSINIRVHNQGAIVMPKARKVTLDSNNVQTLQALLKQLLPAMEGFLSEEAAEPEHQQAAPAAGAATGGAEGAATAAAEQGAANAAAAPAAAPATGEQAVEQPGAAGAAGTGEGEEDNGGDADVGALLTQAIQALQQVATALGGGAAAAPAAPAAPAEGANAEGGEGGEAAGESSAPAGEGGEAAGEGESGEGKDGEQEGANAEGAEEGADGVEPLNGTAQDPNGCNAPGADEGEAGGATGEGGQGTASSGPSAGKHTGADAALRTFYDDLGTKNSLIERLSKVVGAFDGKLDIRRATARDVAIYGVKALKMRGVVDGQEVFAVEAFLTGIEAAKRRNVQVTQQQAADAAMAAEVPVIDAYFKEQK